MNHFNKRSPRLEGNTLHIMRQGDSKVLSYVEKWLMSDLGSDFPSYIMNFGVELWMFHSLDLRREWGLVPPEELFIVWT